MTHLSFHLHPFLKGDTGFCFFQGIGDGFLYKNMLPQLHGLFGTFIMRKGGCYDINHIYRGHQVVQVVEVAVSKFF